MLLLDLLAAATPASVPAPPTRLEPVELFLDADIVVQAVMAGLLLASIWSWMIIISFALKIGGAKKRARKFEQDFWASDNYEQTLDAYRNQDVAPARIASTATATLLWAVRIRMGKAGRRSRISRIRPAGS